MHRTGEITLEEVDEINIKIDFINGVLELIRVLASNELLETVEEKGIASLTGEAQDKLEQIHGLLNKKNEGVTMLIDDEILSRGIEVFGDKDKFIEWLGCPNIALGDITPASLLATEDGRNKVLDIIGRIEGGVYS